MGLIDLGLGGDKGVVGSVVDGGARIVEAKELTKREEAQAWAATKIASAAWRPWLARATGKSLLIYAVGYVSLIILHAYGMISNAPWTFREMGADGDRLPADIDLLWDRYQFLGNELFTFATVFITTYAGARGLEKVAASIGGKAGTVLGRAAGFVTGRDPEPVVTREPLEQGDTLIEARPGVRWTPPAMATKVSHTAGIDLPRLEAEIKREEGFRDHIYLDSLGHATFGYGSLVQPGDPEYGLEIGTPVSLSRVNAAFMQDMQNALAEARRVVIDFDRLPSSAQHVLVSMAFQLGGKGLSKFRNMLAAIKAGDWEQAAAEALNSRAAEQTPARWQRHAAKFASLAEPVVLA